MHFDSRALDALSPLTELPEDPLSALARCDAVVGMAADHIGVGTLTRSFLALDQAWSFLEQAELASFGWRARLRWHWVKAETSLAAGNFGDALTAATRAHTLAQNCPSLRHRLKTRLILAAATTVTSGTSSPDAVEVFSAAVENGLLPLAWAAAMLLSGSDPSQPWSSRAREIQARWR